MGATAGEQAAIEAGVVALYTAGLIDADTLRYFVRPARIAALEAELGIGRGDDD